MAMSIGQLVRPPFFVQAEILQQPLSEMWFRHAMLAEDRILDFNPPRISSGGSQAVQSFHLSS